jgi:hypothetical protein
MSALAQDIRGSQGGLTFSRNRGGAYVRARVAPINPNTNAQRAQRTIFGQNAKAWSGSLSDDQRGAWTAFASVNPVTNVFGESIITSGLAMYTRLNSVLQTIGQAGIDDPPSSLVVPEIAAPLSFSVDTGTLEISITTSAQVVSATTVYYVYATQSLPVGKKPGKSAFRFIGAYAPVAAATSINVQADYFAKFGTPVVGQKVTALVNFANKTSGAILLGGYFPANVA